MGRGVSGKDIRWETQRKRHETRRERQRGRRRAGNSKRMRYCRWREGDQDGETKGMRRRLTGDKGGETEGGMKEGEI